MTEKNYYKILEVDPKARNAVISAAWKTLSRECQDDEPKLCLLNEAHDVLLLDEERRRQFDESLNPPLGEVVRIGPYRLLDRIAKGGFGVTYRAEHEFLHELVCIKHALHITPFDEELMRQEAKTVWNLRHWAIPAIRDIIKLSDGSVAIVMSYVAGPNLQQMVSKNGVYDPEHVCWISERVLNALQYLHFHGIVHGDVKPANIIVQPGTHQVCLVDYGLALVKPGRETGNKGFTPMFSSLEQREGKPLLPESDLYSLGLVMIYALGGDLASLRVPVTVPDAVCDFIRRITARQPLSRPSWKNEDLCRTISDVREKAFGRRGSNMKPLPI